MLPSRSVSVSEAVRREGLLVEFEVRLFARAPWPRNRRAPSRSRRVLAVVDELHGPKQERFLNHESVIVWIGAFRRSISTVFLTTSFRPTINRSPGKS